MHHFMAISSCCLRVAMSISCNCDLWDGKSRNNVKCWGIAMHRVWRLSNRWLLAGQNRAQWPWQPLTHTHTHTCYLLQLLISSQYSSQVDCHHNVIEIIKTYILHDVIIVRLACTIFSKQSMISLRDTNENKKINHNCWCWPIRRSFGTSSPPTSTFCLNLKCSFLAINMKIISRLRWQRKIFRSWKSHQVQHNWSN